MISPPDPYHISGNVVQSVGGSFVSVVKTLQFIERQEALHVHTIFQKESNEINPKVEIKENFQVCGKYSLVKD